MHKYDYSFLESLPLPDNVSGLLDRLRIMQKAFAGKDPKERPLQEPDFSGLPDELVTAYKASSAEPLLLVPCFTLDTICALDSQSSVAGLAKLLLSRSGYSMCKYFPLEESISKYRYFYQRALERASAHWEQNGSAYLYYIEIFLSLLYLCGKDLTVPAGRSTKRAAIEEMVLQSETPISKAEICAALPEVSPTTVEAALGVMVRTGRAKKVGATRAARYIKA